MLCLQSLTCWDTNCLIRIQDVLQYANGNCKLGCFCVRNSHMHYYRITGQVVHLRSVTADLQQGQSCMKTTVIIKHCTALQDVKQGPCSITQLHAWLAALASRPDLVEAYQQFRDISVWTVGHFVPDAIFQALERMQQCLQHFVCS